MKIALVGNQNSGKTTLFNLLTGMNAKIGNWPGVTIERKKGIIKKTNYEITDLPGIYSLSPYSIEEEVSRRFIFEDNPDVIINIIDANVLERSLYLTTQLLELDCKVIVALNMVDLLEKKGSFINEANLAQLLGTKVIRISALNGDGVDELIKEIGNYYSNALNGKRRESYIYDAKLEQSIEEIQKIIQVDRNRRFIAVKLLENDEQFKNISFKDSSLYKASKIENIIKNLESYYNTDLEEVIATERYAFVEEVKNEVFKIKTKIKNETSSIDTINNIDKKAKITVSEKLDKVFLNRWLGIPIFIVIMFFVYYISVGVVGKFTTDFINENIRIFGQNVWTILEKIGITQWLNSLIVDGIISGVGTVVSFGPQLIILFTCISVLETTGYMPRIALLLDRAFRKIGLSGKSLIPFIVGAGCSVPGIMGTRIIENQDEREMTAILTPFIPCSAKLPIIALFSGYFFQENSALISVSLYLLAIVVIIVSAILMKKFVYKNTSSTYMSELPEYKIPNIKYVARDVFDKTIAFFKRAGSVIFICSIVVWFLLSFSLNLEYGVDIENSILATIGRSISWIFYPILGVNSWGAAVSAIQGLVAKEQVISSMSIIGGMSIFDSPTFSFFKPSSAYAFMVFNLFSAPCFGSIAAMRKELGSDIKTIKAVIFQIAIAWILATMINMLGANLILILILMVVIFKIIKENKKLKRECRGCPYCNDCKSML